MRSISLAALAAAAGRSARRRRLRPRRRRRHPDRRHRHDPYRGLSKARLNSSPRSGPPRATSWKSSTRPTRKRSARTPSRWSPKARCRRPRARARAASPRRHLHRRSPNGTASTVKETTINPAEAGPEGWSTMGTTDQEGRLLVHRQEGCLDRPAGDREPAARRSTSCARSIPGCRADQGPAARRLAARPAQLTSHASPGAPAFLGALGGGALALLLPPRAAPRRAAAVRRGPPQAPPRCRSAPRCRSRRS